MDRAFLKLITQRLGQLEKALLNQITAGASGIEGAHVGEVSQARDSLDKALGYWRDWLARKDGQA